MKTHQAIVVGAFSIGVAVSGWSAAKAQQPSRAAGPFTEAQATAGQAAYAQSCAACHGRTLTGAAEAPPLAGTAFMDSWGTRTTQELFGLIRDVDAAGKSEQPRRRHVRANRRIPSQGEWRAERLDRVHAEHERAHRVNRHWRDAGRPACVDGCGPWRTRTWRARRRPRARGRRRLDSRRRAAFGPHRNRNGQELLGDHRRHACATARLGLADALPQLRRVELQPAESDHTEERRRVCS